MKAARKALFAVVLATGLATAIPDPAVAAPPVMPPDAFVQFGDGYYATVSGVETGATVDYGDGSGTQPLNVSAGSAPLSHLYTTEGSFSVTVTNAGEAASSFVHVLLAGALSEMSVFVAPGGIGTAGVPGISATLITSISNPTGSAVAVATYAPSNPAFVVAGPTGSVLAGFDLRAVNVFGGDRITAIFTFPDPGDGSVPSLRFFDPATGAFVAAAGSHNVPDSLVVDSLNNTITIVLDGTSFPNLSALRGTRFAVLGSPRINHLSVKRCVGRGTKARLRFSLSQRATVKVRLRRRRSSAERSRCPHPRRRGRRAPAHLGGGPAIAQDLAAGRATMRIPTGGLRPGRYRVTLKARNSAGTSLKRRRAFVVLRPASG